MLYRLESQGEKCHKAIQTFSDETSCNDVVVMEMNESIKTLVNNEYD